MQNEEASPVRPAQDVAPKERSSPSAPHSVNGEPGSTIAARYRVEQVLHEGRRATVVAARHVGLGTKVAIKFLRPEFRRDRHAVATFEQQSKRLAEIQGDHVLRLFDVGATWSLGSYAVLEYFEGWSLAELLQTQGPLAEPRAVEYVLQACKALAVAHAAGLVHRGIKPASLFLTRRGEFETLKVLDFFGHDNEAEDNARPGTPYMSPEVIRNDATVDCRADIWSLGVTLYELVTGTPDFGAIQPRATAAAADTAALAPSVQRPALSPAMRLVIMRCLDTDPANRFASIDALAAALIPLTTLVEVFRGGLTGVFSRQMLAAASAQARAASVSAPAPARRKQRHSSGLLVAARQRLADAGAALGMRYEAVTSALADWRAERDLAVTRKQLIAIAIAIGIGSVVGFGVAAVRQKVSHTPVETTSNTHVAER